MDISASELARELGLEHRGKDVLITGVSTLECARSGQLSFLGSAKYLARAKESKASCLLVDASAAEVFPCALVSSNVYLDWARIVARFEPPRGDFQGVSDLACIHPEAKLGKDVTVYPFAYVGARTEVGDRVKIFPHCYVAEDCRIGADSTIYPSAVLMARTELGARVVIQPGAVVGRDGFGFAHTPAGHQRIPQIGDVRLEDDVEIGANAAVDRASLATTVVAAGTKIDNLVQIAHNVQVGRHCLFAAQVGIAGSTKIGDFVIMGGKVGVADNIAIGNQVMLGAMTGVTNSLPDGFIGAGSPQLEKGRFQRTVAVLRKLPELSKRVRELEKTVERLVQDNAAGDEKNG
ncbi:MAG: UDP-3-O-(3-hydroxymyristoyl)glucosamine N-acyltransferase [Desulfovibrionaceae bacterium]